MLNSRKAYWIGVCNQPMSNIGPNSPSCNSKYKFYLYYKLRWFNDLVVSTSLGSLQVKHLRLGARITVMLREQYIVFLCFQ